MQFQHTLLYVVQRCWHSGPKQHVPIDLLRLFHTQREAEEAAYHSAKAFHQMNATRASSSTSSSVKTLMLPSYPAHNPQGSSYGFLACGGLFWVRALRATVVTSNNNNGNNNNNNNTAVCNSMAYAILTEGVIGGTGNRNSRRGTEVCDGRVFGGDATARVIAMEAVARVKANLTNASLQVEAKTLPVGKPIEYSSGAFLKDWPQQVVVLDNTMTTTMTTAEDMYTSSTAKRQIGVVDLGLNGGNSSSFYDNGWGRTVSREEDESLVVVDCPFEQPVAKRRRLVSVSVSDSVVQSSMGISNTNTNTTTTTMMQ